MSEGRFDRNFFCVNVRLNVKVIQRYPISTKRSVKKILITYLFSKNHEKQSLYSEIKLLKLHFDPFENFKKSCYEFY